MMLRAAALILALAASSLAWGESFDPPERIAYLSYVEGQVTFEGAHSPATTVLPDRPLASGDRLVTAPGGRAELTLGAVAIRLDESSELAIAALDDSSVRLDLDSGSANLYLRELPEGESFEVVTPNATVTLPEPGEYRLDVPAGDATVLSVRGGAAEVETAAGPVQIVDGQRVRLDGRDAYALLEAPPEPDDFDNWVMDREQRLAAADTSRYGPEDERAYEELDRNGEWTDEPGYGRVWMPAYVDAGWSPYGYGYWQRVGFGFAWIDPTPWGYYTLNRGRWAYLRDRGRWCWVPGRRGHEREFVRDTRPFGHPRGGWRGRDERDGDAPRTVRTVATGFANPRHIDIDRRPMARPDANAGVPARRSTFAPSRGRDPGPPPQASPAPGRHGATMRPSTVSAARNEARWGTATQSHSAFGRPNVP